MPFLIFSLLISFLLFYLYIFIYKIFVFYYWISIIFEILFFHFSFFSYFFIYLYYICRFVNIIFFKFLKIPFLFRNNLLLFVPRFSYSSFYISSEISPISPNHRFFILYPTNFQFYLILYPLPLNSLHFPLSSQFLLHPFLPI